MPPLSSSLLLVVFVVTLAATATTSLAAALACPDLTPGALPGCVNATTGRPTPALQCVNGSITVCFQDDVLSPGCTYNIVAGGTVCRPVAGDCDVAEVCSGVEAECPPDGYVGSGAVCRPAVDDADVDETCTGLSPDCPPDLLACPSDGLPLCIEPGSGQPRVSRCLNTSAQYCVSVANTALAGGVQWCRYTLKPPNALCRASNGPCDVAERCTGFEYECPPDGFKGDTYRCPTSAIDACGRVLENRTVTARCSGKSVDCPAAERLTVAILPSGTPVVPGSVCRAKQLACETSAKWVCPSGGGVRVFCPPTGFAAAGTQCRAKSGACDIADKCTGLSKSCPSNERVAVGRLCTRTALLAPTTLKADKQPPAPAGAFRCGYCNGTGLCTQPTRYYCWHP